MAENSEKTVIQPLLRAGSKQGTKHVRLNYNNQDAFVYQTFTIPAFNKHYCVGLVSDGCSGNPSFSHSEVGAHLMCLYAYRRIQELICTGVAITQIPQVLYPSVTECILDIMTKIMPTHVLWKYPVVVKDREDWNGQTRFKNDYLAATLLGFISDGEDLVLFSAGDGVIIVNDNVMVIDQNNRPDYPAISVNKPGSGFDTKVFALAEVKHAVVSTDGLQKLLQDDEKFRAQLFDFQKGKFAGVQMLLNVTSNQKPEFMLDDCTVITFENGIQKKG